MKRNRALWKVVVKARGRRSAGQGGGDAPRREATNPAQMQRGGLVSGCFSGVTTCGGCWLPTPEKR
jgi:hypothetical protein